MGLKDLAKQATRDARTGGPLRDVSLPVVETPTTGVDQYDQERPGRTTDWDLDARASIRYTDCSRDHRNPRSDGLVTVATITFPRWMGPSSASVTYRYDQGFQVVIAQSEFRLVPLVDLINWIADVASRLTDFDNQSGRSLFQEVVDQSVRGYLPAAGQINRETVRDHALALMVAAA